MNSRQLAKTWPYPRHASYERELRKTAAAWFAKKGYAVDNPFFRHWVARTALPDVGPRDS